MEGMNLHNINATPGGQAFLDYMHERYNYDYVWSWRGGILGYEIPATRNPEREWYPIRSDAYSNYIQNFSNATNTTVPEYTYPERHE
jgi:hypothetical protein